MSSNLSVQIKKLIRKSESGSFSSSYQLYKIYSEGEYGVAADLEKSNFFKELSSQQMMSGQFRIAKISLTNYKGFENINLDFSIKKKTTVLVGNNGSGKSTILDAIQKSMSHLTSRLSTRSHNGENIERFEIRKGKGFSTINIIFVFSDVKFSMTITQTNLEDEGKLKSDYSGINELGNLFKMANSVNPSFPFPLIAAYTIERANDVSTKDIENSDEIKEAQTWDKFKGYSKSLTGKADFRLFFRWYKELIEIENSDNTDIKLLKAEIQNKENDLNNPLLKALLAENNNSELTTKLIEDHNRNLSNLKEKLNSYYTINSKTLHIVQNAIYSFLPGFNDLKLQRSPLDLTVCKDGVSLSVLQLSQGEKSILALVADIARRLTLLNPALENPLTGTGIVLIDEIDLHLHPSWQQKIIQRLENTFINIQFIVTTHSPQVCHTIDSDNIWLLKEGSRYKAPKGTRGAISSWVLKNLFYVEERPPEDEFTKKLEKYKKLVHSDQYNSENAKKLKADLSKHFGADYDVLVELNFYIENREWEKSFESDK